VPEKAQKTGKSTLGDGVMASWNRLAPALTGTTPKDYLLGGFGAFLGIGCSGLLVALGVPGSQAPLIVAPLGASAVLVFAVPSSPLAQPWSVIGGNVISCLVALAAIRVVPNPFLVTAVAVGAAIVVMSTLRCLHPPGGAVALLTSLAAHHKIPPDVMFAFLPIGANSLALVLVGLIFHRFSGHSYPHIAAPSRKSAHGTVDAPPLRRAGIRARDLDAVLGEMHESFDIDREDLEELLWRLEERAFARTNGSPRCADVMSRDVITIPHDASVAEAREKMLSRRLRCLPAVNRLGVYAGMVEARHLIEDAALVAAVMTTAPVARSDAPVLDFASAFVSGGVYEIVVVDADYRILGLVTQTDMLAVMLRALNRAA
jgi:CBS domain-containing membrane protein